MYLENHQAYIGQIKSTRFSWMEYKEEFNQSEGRVTKVEKPASQNSSAIAMDYEVLKEINGLDLEKYEQIEPNIKPFDNTPEAPIYNEPIHETNDKQAAQPPLPF